MRLAVGRPFLPFADGAPTPSGKVGAHIGDAWRARACQPCPPTCRCVEGPEHAEMARRYPLQCIVPPNRFFPELVVQRVRAAAPPPGRAGGLPAIRRRAARAASSRATRSCVRSARGEARFTARASPRTRGRASSSSRASGGPSTRPGGRERQRAHRRPRRGHGRWPRLPLQSGRGHAALSPDLDPARPRRRRPSPTPSRRAVRALDEARLQREYWDQDEFLFVPEFLPRRWWSGSSRTWAGSSRG